MRGSDRDTREDRFPKLLLPSLLRKIGGSRSGGRPYLLAAAFAAAMSPIPLLLKRSESEEGGDVDATLTFGADAE